jgi:ElaB/YqjD/DUF883 family membrane-anchored ribosome-binding protein
MGTACSKKHSLLLAWQATTQSYSEAVTELAEKVGRISSDEYQMLKNRAERALSRSSEARNTLELHVEDHRC